MSKISFLSRRWLRPAALVGILLGAAPVVAQQMDDEVLSRVSKRRVWTPPTRFGTGGVLGLVFVDVDRNQLAVVVEGLRRSDELPSRILSFYFRKGGRLIEKYRFTTTLFFVGMYPTPDGERLVTTWAAGSAYRTIIFALQREAVRGVLWLGWQWPLEFVDLDGDGEEEIIHGVDGFAGAPPERADIYKWTGRDYQLLRSVPWSARYDRK